MSSKKRFVIPAVLATLAVVGCSSDSDDNGDGATTEGTTTEGATTEGTTTEGTTTEGTTTEGTTTEGTTTEGTTTEGTTTEGTTTDGTASGSFFNDDSGVDFANSIGGSVSQIFSSAFSAVPLLFSGGTFGDGAAPRLARATDTGTEACFTSGSIDFTFVTNDATGNPESASIDFNNCNDEGDITTGGFDIAFTGNFDSENGSMTLTFNNFNVLSGGETANIDGGISMGISTVGDTITVAVQGTSLSMSSSGGLADSSRSSSAASSVTFSNFNLTTTTNNTSGDSSVSGQAGITTPEGSLQISMDPPLQVLGDADFPTTGVVSMTASDGSSLVIDADSGDPATYIYTINDQGAVSSGTANWADSGIEGLDTDFE